MLKIFSYICFHNTINVQQRVKRTIMHEKGVYIPTFLASRGDLKWLHKVILSEVYRLQQTDLGCFRSNDNWAKYCHISTPQVRKYIAHLESNNFLIARYDGNKRYLELGLAFKSDQKRAPKVIKNEHPTCSEVSTQGDQKRAPKVIKNEHPTCSEVSTQGDQKRAPKVIKNEHIDKEDNKKVKIKDKYKQMNLPHTSDEFRNVWVRWIDHRWAKNRRYTQENLEKYPPQGLKNLADYEVEFAIELLTKAINSGWTGFHFSNTPDEYKKWKSKQGTATKQAPLGETMQRIKMQEETKKINALEDKIKQLTWEWTKKDKSITKEVAGIRFAGIFEKIKDLPESILKKDLEKSANTLWQIIR